VSDRRAHGRFATTRWSVVLAAGADRTSPGARQALTTLCETYWYPLYAFLRSRGHHAEEAEDLTQAFFARLIDKHALQQADPTRGRFRSFLLTSLTHFVANERDREMARKRGGGCPLLALEFDAGERRFQEEPSSDETPERIFDRRWALTVLDRVINRLRTEMSRRGQQTRFDALKTYLTGDTPQLTYAETAAEVGMSEAAVKVAVHRMRVRFRELLWDEIAQTVSSRAEIEDELSHLRSAVATR
jgi:RNA polymerase sigma factor (sigma-70 family)